MMRKCLLGAVAAAFLLASPPVSAVMIDYTFEPGTSACFNPDGCLPGSSFLLEIAGGFTFDTALLLGEALPSTNITLTGGQLPSPFSSVTLLQGSETGARSIAAQGIEGSTMFLVLIPFAFPLADAVRDPLSIAFDNFQFQGESADSVTGAAVPGAMRAPEPTSLALIVVALGLLCLGNLRKFV
jgi:hypothetical protein